MHKGHRALVGRRVECLAQPLDLRGTVLAPTDLFTLRIESDNLPVPDMERVIALRLLTRGRAEVVEVRLGPRRFVPAVSRDRLGPGAMVILRRIVAVGEIGDTAVRISSVPQDYHRPLETVQQPCRRLIIVRRARRDITCRDDDTALGFPESIRRQPRRQGPKYSTCSLPYRVDYGRRARWVHKT